MKKLTKCVVTELLLLPFISTRLKAGTESRPASLASTKTVESAEGNALLTDKSNLKMLVEECIFSAEAIIIILLLIIILR